MDKNHWFIEVAKVISTQSHCLSWKAGCIIVKDKQIISTGYNGPPTGYPHCEWRNDKGVLFGGHQPGEWSDIKSSIICPRKRMGFKSGEGLEFCPASHAEANAIVQAAKMGININDASMYCAFSMIPCRECSKLIVNAGIKEVYLIGIPIDYPQQGIRGREILKGIVEIRGLV